MATPEGLTAAQHRAEALDLLAEAQRYPYHSTGRAAKLAEASIHALLAITGPETPVVELAAVEPAPEPAPAPKATAKKRTTKKAADESTDEAAADALADAGTEAAE